MSRSIAVWWSDLCNNHDNINLVWTDPNTGGRLYIGDYHPTQHLKILIDRNITYVLNAGSCINLTTQEGQLPNEILIPEMVVRDSNEFVYLALGLSDTLQENDVLNKYLEVSVRFIQGALENGQHIFVHCSAGISRSCSLIIAYLIKTQFYSYSDALELIRVNRPIVCPNRRFRRTLLLYQRDLKSMQLQC